MIVKRKSKFHVEFYVGLKGHHHYPPLLGRFGLRLTVRLGLRTGLVGLDVFAGAAFWTIFFWSRSTVTVSYLGPSLGELKLIVRSRVAELMSTVSVKYPNSMTGSISSVQPSKVYGALGVVPSGFVAAKPPLPLVM